jgi:NAD(P)-dependent dehydrogenase (short-subunit alcohol dehydrogenase family)
VKPLAIQASSFKKIFMQKGSEEKPVRPAQQTKGEEGQEEQMDPQPVYEKEKKEKRLENKVTIITGGDSGIGRAIAIAFAKEGAKLLIVYHEDHKDADKTKALVEQYGGQCELLAGDISDADFCNQVIDKTIEVYGAIDVLINNAAVQFPQKQLADITVDQLRRTFEVNIFSQFYLVKAAEPHLKGGASIINTASVTAYRGSKELLDYSATKGAIVSFTRALSAYFAKKNIRVNGVAPGPIWTPLIPSTFPPDHVANFGTDSPMGRAGEPVEVAYSYVFLASDEASYISGQVLHPNGGEIING